MLLIINPYLLIKVIGMNKSFLEKVKEFQVAILALAIVTSSLTVSVAMAATTAFKDIPVDFWGAQAVSWAAEAGLMGKNTDGTYSENFRPTDNLTRAELATVLYRYHKMTNPELASDKKVITVVSSLTANSSYSTLVKLIKSAGLTELLSDDGPFTVFAPNNAAFDKVGSATLTDLLEPENKQKLTRLLTYHVVPGKIVLNELKDGQKLKTIQGQELSVKVTTTGEGTTATRTVYIDEAKVTTSNIVASNGMIHQLDSVVTPETTIPGTTTPTTSTTGTTTGTTGSTTSGTTGTTSGTTNGTTSGTTGGTTTGSTGTTTGNSNTSSKN
jgi:uncharacterized surface protein with fasciclin (FAS1) repeats